MGLFKKMNGETVKNKIIFLILFFLAFAPMRITAEEPDPDQISSDQLTQTKFTSYLQTNIPEGTNLLYCSTIQLAWNELCDDFVSGQLLLEGEPSEEKMLNERLTGKNDISEDSYLVMVGTEKDGITEKIKEAMKKKFNRAPSIPINLQSPMDVLAYAYLSKDLKFEDKFENIPEPVLFNTRTPVKAFGIIDYDKNLADQVTIYDYNNQDDFVLGLKSSSPDDEIILAKIIPKKTLLETIDFVFSRIQTGNSPSDIKAGETLKIPKLNFDIIHQYAELQNRNFLNKGFEDYFIRGVVQSIRFRLDEKGALLRSEAALQIGGGMPRDYSIPRKFIFDKPFFLCLKEKEAKYPYFAIWIANAELLLKFKPSLNEENDVQKKLEPYYNNGQ